MVHNIYVIPLREQSVFKSDYTIKKKKVSELSLTVVIEFNKDN